MWFGRKLRSEMGIYGGTLGCLQFFSPLFQFQQTWFMSHHGTISWRNPSSCSARSRIHYNGIQKHYMMKYRHCDGKSVLKVTDNCEGEIGMQQMGLPARLMSQALRKMFGNASKAQSVYEALELRDEGSHYLGKGVLKEKLALSALQKLGEPMKCIMTLKAYLHNYAGRNQIKFNVHFMSAEDLPKPTNRSEELLALPPNTPNKKS